MRFETLGRFGGLPEPFTVHKGEALFPRIDAAKDVYKRQVGTRGLADKFAPERTSLRKIFWENRRSR